VLTGCYWRAPFGSVEADYPDGSGLPEVQINNPSDGILGGDCLKMDVALTPDSANLLTQAAKTCTGEQRLARARFFASRRNVSRAPTAPFDPFRTLQLSATDRYSPRLRRDAHRLGRRLRRPRGPWGAVRLRRTLRRTCFFRENLPEVVDGFDLYAGGEPFGNYSYMGAAYVLAARDLGPLVEKLHGVLSGAPRVLASAGALAPRLCTIRVLARDAAALYRVLNAFRRMSRAYLDLPHPAREIS
jgi:hypothetical protein